MLPRPIVLIAGSVRLLTAWARAAQPASEIWVPRRLSVSSLASPPVGGRGVPGGGGGGTRAARPASPNGLPLRARHSSAGSRRRASARATSPASPMPVPPRKRRVSRGMPPRPRAAASAEAPASPTCIPKIWR
eukprot:scaffold39418_cov50-Phaeocystis_antarctica.AAC.4